MSQAVVSFPDPVLTANLYCRGYLDQILQRVMLPLSRDLAGLDPSRTGYIWVVRYRRCGEHLKVRMHVPEALQPQMRESLANHAGVFFAALGEPETTGENKPETEVPGIDFEDLFAENYPDRSLLWTHYRRSHISLGGKPFLDDDRYVALMTICLGRACERVLEVFAEGEISHSHRQTLLLDSLIEGLDAVGFTADLRTAYLKFHRDWLLRFNLVSSGVNQERMRTFLDKFERNADGAVTVTGQLRDMAAQRWSETSFGGAPVANDGNWAGSLRDLFTYVRPLSADPDYHLDPFADDPVFPVLFKVLHGLANQLGLKMLDEALAYHLLLRATSDTGSSVLKVDLVPS